MAPSSSSSLSERFRRAIQQDDLNAAQRLWDRVQSRSQSNANGQLDSMGSSSVNSGANDTFDIRNQTMLFVHHDQQSSSSSPSTLQRSSSYDRHSNHGMRQFPLADALGECLALSASQANVARHSRLRERNREAARAKSSLALAVESGASIELIQWLLDMGHERGDFSRDMRGCTTVSLAAQYNRTDVIEACCIDAVAHAATLHHQRSLMYGFDYNMMHKFAAEEEEEDEEEEQRRTGDRLEGGKGTGHLESPADSLSPALTLVTANASTPSRRPSPNPVQLAKHLQQQYILQQRRDQARGEEKQALNSSAIDDEDDDNDEGNASASVEASSEMDDIVGVTIQRLVDCPDELGRTGLALASMKGHEEAVKLLIDLGASLDLGDYEGNRPLHYASAYNQLIIVQLLIERGCSYSLQNVLGFSAADYAWSTSLKSALEAFARAQFDAKRVRNRGHANSNANNAAASSSLANASNSNGGALATTSSASTAAPSVISSSALGLFPAPLRTPDHSLPASPQHKLSAQLRDVF